MLRKLLATSRPEEIALHRGRSPTESAQLCALHSTSRIADQAREQPIAPRQIILLDERGILNQVTDPSPTETGARQRLVDRGQRSLASPAWSLPSRPNIFASSSRSCWFMLGPREASTDEAPRCPATDGAPPDHWRPKPRLRTARYSQARGRGAARRRRRASASSGLFVLIGLADCPLAASDNLRGVLVLERHSDDNAIRSVHAPKVVATVVANLPPPGRNKGLSEGVSRSSHTTRW